MQSYFKRDETEILMLASRSPTFALFVAADLTEMHPFLWQHIQKFLCCSDFIRHDSCLLNSNFGINLTQLTVSRAIAAATATIG